MRIARGRRCWRWHRGARRRARFFSGLCFWSSRRSEIGTLARASGGGRDLPLLRDARTIPHRLTSRSSSRHTSTLGRLGCPLPVHRTSGQDRRRTQQLKACGIILYWCNRIDLDEEGRCEACTPAVAILIQHGNGAAFDVLRDCEDVWPRRMGSATGKRASRPFRCGAHPGRSDCHKPGCALRAHEPGRILSDLVAFRERAEPRMRHQSFGELWKQVGPVASSSICGDPGIRRAGACGIEGDREASRARCPQEGLRRRVGRGPCLSRDECRRWAPERRPGNLATGHPQAAYARSRSPCGMTSYSGADSEEPYVLEIVTPTRQSPCEVVARSTDLAFAIPSSDGVQNELHLAANRMASAKPRLWRSMPGLRAQGTKGTRLQSHVEKNIPRQAVEILWPRKHTLSHLFGSVCRGRGKDGTGRNPGTRATQDTGRARSVSHVRTLQQSRKRDFGPGRQEEQEIARSSDRNERNQAQRTVLAGWYSAFQNALSLRRWSGCEGGAKRTE